MGEQLYAVVYKKRVPKVLKSGKSGKDKWVRGYRAPRPEDDNRKLIEKLLAEKLPEWEALDIVPSEKVPNGNKTTELHRYGMPFWSDLFSPRQLLCHCTGVEAFQEMLEAERKEGKLMDIRRAAYGYLALSLSKSIYYNSRMCAWHSYRSVTGNTFSQHDFSFKWSYAEMAPLVAGLGYDWVINQTTKCIGELVSLIYPSKSGNTHVEEFFLAKNKRPKITISCKSGDSLDHIQDGHIDAVIMDPPYYDNVMYAELSDFFYVWLKRTAGHVYPELFRRILTDKESEAVANPAKFRSQKGARARARIDYQERMASIFAECRRVLKSDGILTLMFTHKAAGAWDALAKGLMKAGFVITASWPVNTEAEGSLHIQNKAAAKSTIFLVCRPRANDAEAERNLYWEDVEPEVAKAVRQRIRGFQEAGIAGVDLYLACFGPALKEFSRHWPLRRGAPRELPAKRKKQQQVVNEGEWDQYEVTPEDALDAARREVKRWRLEQLTKRAADTDLDPSTAFFVLAWDAFRAPIFPYDEALRLAHAVGADLDRDIVDRLAGKKGGDIILWDSALRVAKGKIGPIDGSRGMIDAIHRSADLARARSLDVARESLTRIGLDKSPLFFASLESVLEVLPVPKGFTGIELNDKAEASGNDFEVLYRLSRLAYSEHIGEPKQLKFWNEEKT